LGQTIKIGMTGGAYGAYRVLVKKK